MTTSHRNDGFTLIEVMIVLAVAVPMLLVIGSAGRAATGSFTATERAAATTQVVLKSLAEVERALRFGARETLRTPATDQDVRLHRATEVGEWIALPPNEPRTEIEVSALIGDDGPELLIPRQLHRLTFVPDPAETLDGVDNDGDGLVDEGALQFTRGDETMVLADQLEQCTFELVGKSVRVALRYVRPGHGRELRRTTLQHSVYLINP